MGAEEKAVVLLSGGFDSAALIMWAQQKLKYEVDALFINIGQPAAVQELDAAFAVSRLFNVPLHEWCGPRLQADANGYIPARNLVLGSQAVSLAQSIGAKRVLFGFVIAAGMTNERAFGDTSYAFCNALQSTARIATKDAVKYVDAPLLHVTKGQVRAWLKARRMLTPIARATWTCWWPQKGRPCMQCDACQQRKAARVDGDA